ncbi:MAG: hypothetical protein U1A77_01735 [Pirellulales bacterium]
MARMCWWSGVVVAVAWMAIVVSGGWQGTAVGHHPKPQFGDISIFSMAPADPGFPEGIAIHGNRVFVSGPARFGTAGTGPSKIHVYRRSSGALESSIVVQGEALAFEHALSNVAVDKQGRVYALSTQLGLLRFKKHGGGYVQEFFGAPLPDLPAAGNVLPGEPSSPTAFDLPPICNDIVFDDDGNAYVTDSLQATIFRYSPQGGAPEIWFQSSEFEGGGFFPFGTNGVRLDPEQENLYVVVTTSATNPNRGAIYRLPLVESPSAADLEVVHEYVAGEGPDQMAIGEEGLLYVTLAFSNQLSIVAPNGVELGRIASQPTDTIPLDNPAALAFDRPSKSLLVVNHSLLAGNPDHFAVLKVFVDDRGQE